MYFPASAPAQSFMSGIGLNRRPDGVSVTCIFIPSRMLYFFLSGAGIVTWPFLVTFVVSNFYVLYYKGDTYYLSFGVQRN